MQNALARLMGPDDILETFHELASTEGVAALLNVQALDGSNAELKPRAIKDN